MFECLRNHDVPTGGYYVDSTLSLLASRARTLRLDLDDYIWIARALNLARDFHSSWCVGKLGI
jgi:hypothetical protein